jgi:hypothetical protein
MIQACQEVLLRQSCSEPGLPDGLFSNQKIPIWVNFGWPKMENVDIFYDHSEYFTEIWDNV